MGTASSQKLVEADAQFSGYDRMHLIRVLTSGFGRWNRENLQLRTQIRTLMQQTEELSQIAKRQKERLRQEEQRNREIFGRVAAMLDRMRNDLDRVRLSTQLNSNAIDRLMLEDEAEPEAIEEPLTTMEEPMEEIESAVEIETTADAAESIAPEPEQVTESIDESVSPEMPIEPKRQLCRMRLQEIFQICFNCK